jgi:hypothetical protein
LTILDENLPEQAIQPAGTAAMVEMQRTRRPQLRLGEGRIDDCPGDVTERALVNLAPLVV